MTINRIQWSEQEHMMASAYANIASSFSLYCSFIFCIPGSSCYRIWQLVQKQKSIEVSFNALCGAYGTRTRDPMRDRHVF